MTRYLLDSHVLIWWKEQPGSLSPAAREAITSGTNQLFFSHASLWELHIKISRGRLKIPEPLLDVAASMRCHLLPITTEHIEEIQHLPEYHRDPFDRMLVAQAVTDGLTLVTRDNAMQQYHVAILAA
ncbi:MAG: type II toxin-antitoxin system VapC family toxin [Pirellulaceae bacterium]